jgi:c-di-GMP-binding flagellar brake protein YcgR
MENTVENFANVEEKRRYKRVDSVLPVQYKNLRTATDLPIGSTTRNLSEGGICFKSSKFISLACRLVVEISLPTSPKPIKAISKVAWIRKLPSTDQYELGNQFLEITKEDKAHILNFVNQSIGPAI